MGETPVFDGVMAAGGCEGCQLDTVLPVAPVVTPEFRVEFPYSGGSGVSEGVENPLRVVKYQVLPHFYKSGRGDTAGVMITPYLFKVVCPFHHYSLGMV